MKESPCYKTACSISTHLQRRQRLRCLGVRNHNWPGQSHGPCPPSQKSLCDLVMSIPADSLVWERNWVWASSPLIFPGGPSLPNQDWENQLGVHNLPPWSTLKPFEELIKQVHDINTIIEGILNFLLNEGFSVFLIKGFYINSLNCLLLTYLPESQRKKSVKLGLHLIH
jgi:hypothetical protein